ncbi:hypothetical protein ACE6H2_026107 [Prunus campanulata]
MVFVDMVLVDPMVKPDRNGTEESRLNRGGWRSRAHLVATSGGRGLSRAYPRLLYEGTNAGRTLEENVEEALGDNKGKGKEMAVCQDVDEAGISNHKAMIAEFVKAAALAKWIMTNL